MISKQLHLSSRYLYRPSASIFKPASTVKIVVNTWQMSNIKVNLYNLYTRTKQSAIHPASWISRHRQFRNTLTSLRFVFLYRKCYLVLLIWNLMTILHWGHNPWPRLQTVLTYSRLNVRKHFFCERVVPIRNNLECNIIDFSSIKRFKSSLLSCNQNRYTHF